MKRTVLSVLLGMALSAVGVIIAASQVEGELRVTEVWPIALAVAATVAAWLLQGSIIALLSWPRLGSLQIPAMTRVYLATQAAGAITPFAGGEIAYQILELDRQGLSPEYAGAVITIRSLMNGVVMFTGAAVALFFVPRVPFVGETDLPVSAHNALVWATIALAGLAAIAAMVYRRRSTGGEKPEEAGWAGKAVARISGYARRGKDYALHVRDSLVRIWREEPRVVLGCLGLMMLYWAIYPLLGTLALRACGWDGAGWIHVYLAQYVLFLVIPLAPTPGNSGAAELAFVALMGAYVPHGALIGGVVIWRALNHYSEQIVGGFIAGRHLPEDVEIARREFGSGPS